MGSEQLAVPLALALVLLWGLVAVARWLLGALVVGLAFWVEFHFAPPLWVHAVIWPIFTIPVAILMMRPLKAALVALQYRHRPVASAQDDE